MYLARYPIALLMITIVILILLDLIILLVLILQIVINNYCLSRPTLYNRLCTCAQFYYPG